MLFLNFTCLIVCIHMNITLQASSRGYHHSLVSVLFCHSHSCSCGNKISQLIKQHKIAFILIFCKVWNIYVNSPPMFHF